MINKRVVMPLYACLLSAAAHAAPMAELRVTGRILPDACVPDFIGGGVLDYGVMPASALQSRDATLLSRRSMAIHVSCAMPAKVGIRLLDNRPAMAIAGMVKTSVRPSMLRDERYFGLSSDGRAVGGYVLGFEAGGRAAGPGLQWDPPSGAWQPRKDGMLLKDTLYTWSENGRAPAKMRHMGATLSVQPLIDARAEELKNDIPLEGSATLELVYF